MVNSKARRWTQGRTRSVILFSPDFSCCVLAEAWTLDQTSGCWFADMVLTGALASLFILVMLYM